MKDKLPDISALEKAIYIFINSPLFSTEIFDTLSVLPKLFNFGEWQLIHESHPIIY